MFPQFGATVESLSRASSLMLRIGTDAHLYDDPDDVSIAPLLDSRFDSEKAEALKRLLALIAQGADVSNFFPQVVKNVASQSLEVKKLVYLYLLHYAERRPDEALLSINCFQKDLSDTNPLVRAWALRAMAGIRLHVVAPLVLAAVGKCARDPSPYVRKCAAHALTKLHDLHQEENVIALEELVGIFLSDHTPGVVGAAASSFNSICPNNLALVGKNFRRLCETLPDVEEWGQIVLINILLRYVVSRHGLVRGSIMFSSNSTMITQSNQDSASVSHGYKEDEASDTKLNMLMFKYYIEGQEEHLLNSGLTSGDFDKLADSILTSSQNDDVNILLHCTSPLLWSQNSAVVLAAAGVHWIMAPKEEVKRIVKPLLFLLRSSNASKYVILCNIQVFGKAVPSFFAPYFEDFFVCTSDSYQIKALKLEILSTIATDSSIPIIFEEFQDYIKDPDRRFVADTVAAIGLCAQRLPSVANTSMEGLLSLIAQESITNNLSQLNGEAGVLVQAIVSIKTILKQNPSNLEKVIGRLARNLDFIKEPSARALIVWIVGEYNSSGQIISTILPTLLKYLAWCFVSEEVETKHQILNTVAKSVLCAQGEELPTFKMILNYIVELAKYDLNYDVRDRARIVEEFIPCHITSPCPEEGSSYTMQNGHISREFVGSIFSGKVPSKNDPGTNFRFYLPGSLSQIVLHAAPGYVPLPKPCSLLNNDLNLYSESVQETNDGDMYSGSSVEESGSYDSQHSFVSSADSDGTGSESGSNVNGHNDSLLSVHGYGKEKEVPLVHLADAVVNDSLTDQCADENMTTHFSKDLAELMSKSALESWLDEQPSISSVQKAEQVPSARISITDLGLVANLKIHTLLDPTNGNGLRVECTFPSEISTISPSLICVEFIFGNCSTEPLMRIGVKDYESDKKLESANQVLEKTESLFNTNDLPTILPMEEISLDPGQTTTKVLQVRFHHHLLPLKLAVFCNGQKHMIKLWPDIGYFVRPLSMNIESFTEMESQLPGMFEYAKRCTFTDHIQELGHADQSLIHTDKILAVSRSLASKMLSNANVCLVSVDMPVSFNVDDASGLCLRFSGEILSSLKPCLITIMVEGKCSEVLNINVKVNCEETIFGLNLLNRIVAFLQ